jgi:hypothetical protein
MKTAGEMLNEMREALAHHEQEAAKLRVMIAAAEGTPPASGPWPSTVPQILPIVPQPLTPYVPPGKPPWLPDTVRFGEIICGAPTLSFG